MDEQEFDAFYTASFTRVVSQVHAMIGDRDEAQECVQEAFVRAWSHRTQLEKAHAPEAWVRTTAYRLAVSRWRRVVRSRRSPDRARRSSDLLSRRCRRVRPPPSGWRSPRRSGAGRAGRRPR